MTQEKNLNTAELYDYLNGHLPAEEVARIQDLAASDPEVSALIEEERAHLTLMRKSLPPVGKMPAAVQPRSGRTHWKPALAAAVVAFAIGIGADNLMRTGDVDEIEIASTQVTAEEQIDALLRLAAEAHSNSRLRLRMASQVEHLVMDATELTRATGIRVPTLPEGWSLKDVQVYPSPYGPSVEIAVSTADNGLISIYAVNVGNGRTMRPVPHGTPQLTSALFQIDQTAYVLVGQTAPAPLDDEAGELFRRLL